MCYFSLAYCPDLALLVKLSLPTPFRCVQAATIIITPSPTKTVFVTHCSQRNLNFALGELATHQ